MPKYEPVPSEAQIPKTRRAPSSPAGAETEIEEVWVPITTTIPAGLRREITVACAVHGIKLKDAVTQALAAWLDEANANK